MSTKRKKNSGRPAGRPIPAPPGFSGEEVDIPDGALFPLPRVCPRCWMGVPHESTLSIALHDDARLSPVQRDDALALLGIGVPGDALLLACCACDFLEAIEVVSGFVRVHDDPIRCSHP